MISVTEYVILKMLLKRGEVSREDVYNFIVIKLPTMARLITVASPYELYEEFDIITSVLVEKGCVKKTNNKIVFNNNRECERKIEEYVRVIENEAEKITPSLIGSYIAIVKAFID